MHRQDRETVHESLSIEEQLYQLVDGGALSIHDAQKALETPNTFSTIVFSLPEMEVPADLLACINLLVVECMGDN